MLALSSRRGLLYPRVGHRAKAKTRRRRLHRPLLGNPYLLKVQALRRTLSHWDSLFAASEETRVPQLVRLNVVGEFLVNKYSWAIPDSRAIRILSAYAPLIEIGCGLGYWSRLLHDRGVDIIAADRLGPLPASWTYIVKGGPLLLSKSYLQGRNLFLCYPDENSCLGSMCLKYFTGEYLIHVGELLVTGTQCGYPQRPWGRTSSADFQVELYEKFHCILSVALHSYPVGRDFITVWKRTKFVRGIHQDEMNDDTWASIPFAEQMNEDRAAPCCRHLVGRRKNQYRYQKN